MHPDAAVELLCQEGSASMKHIVITQPPPGLCFMLVMITHQAHCHEPHSHYTTFLQVSGRPP